MQKRNSHLGAAQRHGRKAITELRHMTADSALYWVLAHKTRVAAFRRAVKGTPAAKPFDQLLAVIRSEATALPRPAVRKARRTRVRRARKSRFLVQPYMLI